MNDVWLRQRADYDVMSKGLKLGSIIQWVDGGSWWASTRDSCGNVFGLEEYESMKEAQDAVVRWHTSQGKQV